MYYAGIDDDQLITNDNPYPDRRPHGRLEHVALDIPWDQFQAFLSYHLRCQIRDCYLARGEDPPEQYRVLGPGTDHMMVRCLTRDLLPAYHDYNPDIDGNRAEYTFNRASSPHYSTSSETVHIQRYLSSRQSLDASVQLADDEES